MFSLFLERCPVWHALRIALLLILLNFEPSLSLKVFTNKGLQNVYMHVHTKAIACCVYSAPW